MLLAVGCASSKPPPPDPAPLEITPMPSAKGATTSTPIAAPPPAPKGHCGKATVGKSAPPLQVKSVSGSSVEVGAGHVTVVHMWATWCGPCSQSFPKFEKLWEKNGGRGMDLVAVSVDDEIQPVPQFAKQHGARFSIAYDEGHVAAECWKVQTMPTTYVIDREGVLRFEHDGWHDGEADVIEKEVESLL